MCVDDDDDEAQVESSAGEDRADIKSVCESLLSLCPAVLRRLLKKKKAEDKGGKKIGALCVFRCERFSLHGNSFLQILLFELNDPVLLCAAFVRECFLLAD